MLIFTSNLRIICLKQHRGRIENLRRLPISLQTNKASMFADDTNLSCKRQTSADIEYKLNCDLENIQKWLISNKLTLNSTKTEFMLIGSQQRLDKIMKTTKILFGEHEIKRVREKTVLSLVIDEQLKWNKHNDEQCKKISKSIALLRNAKDFFSQEELITIYNSLVLPHFNYCSTLWNDNNKTDIDKLSKLQKKSCTGYN